MIKIKQFLTEEFATATFNYKNKYVEFFKNPSSKERQEMDIVRCFLYKTGDFYIWDAYISPHIEGLKVLEFELKLEGIYQDYINYDYKLGIPFNSGTTDNNKDVYYPPNSLLIGAFYSFDHDLWIKKAREKNPYLKIEWRDER